MTILILERPLRASKRTILILEHLAIELATLVPDQPGVAPSQRIIGSEPLIGQALKVRDQQIADPVRQGSWSQSAPALDMIRYPVQRMEAPTVSVLDQQMGDPARH
jgi:hypothetical protein